MVFPMLFLCYIDSRPNVCRSNMLEMLLEFEIFIDARSP